MFFSAPAWIRLHYASQSFLLTCAPSSWINQNLKKGSAGV
jgi:hypothetical protein